MNFSGIVLAIVTVAIIGVFHPIVIWAGYHFSKKIWYVFLIFGVLFLEISGKSNTKRLSPSSPIPGLR
ncbi:MAG: DUF4491 family protein [Lachnospiraceae bacterium]|nr:DUF4491 family protein [Lachnospiraceae bacterium]